MSGFATSGEGSDQVVTNTGHDNIDHTAAPLNLLSGSAHDAIDHESAPLSLLAAATHAALDHSSIPGVNPTQVSPAERTAGTEALLRSFSPFDIATMAGIHGGIQVSQFTFTWTNNAAGQSTGALGFTPLFAIAIGMFAHDAVGTAAGGFGAGTNSSMSFGFATGTGSNAKSVSQHCEDGGSNDDDATSHDGDSIGGVTAVNTGAALAHSVADLDVTVWGSGGITLDPSVAVTARVSLLVIGA